MCSLFVFVVFLSLSTGFCCVFWESGFLFKPSLWHRRPHIPSSSTSYKCRPMNNEQFYKTDCVTHSMWWGTVQWMIIGICNQNEFVFGKVSYENFWSRQHTITWFGFARFATMFPVTNEQARRLWVGGSPIGCKSWIRRLKNPINKIKTFNSL